jgi:hypothetical protein
LAAAIGRRGRLSISASEPACAAVHTMAHCPGVLTRAALAGILVGVEGVAAAAACGVIPSYVLYRSKRRLAGGMCK